MRLQEFLQSFEGYKWNFVSEPVQLVLVKIV